MGFKLGQGGRPKGAINKASKEFRAVLEEAGFCAATALMDIYKTAMARFAEEIEKEDRGTISPMESNAAKYLKIAGDKVSDIASFAYPKLKAIEQTKVNPLADMSTQEKLEAMKQAVAALEAKVKADGPGVS